MAFVHTLVSETGPEIQRTLEYLRDAYNRRTPDPILGAEGFYERFTPELVEFLRRCAAYGPTQLRAAPGNRLTPKLARFVDILIQDSTVIRLFPALARVFPATRSRGQAARVKVATLYCARANGPTRLELFGERTAEIDTLEVGPWVMDAILLIDLGFYKHQGFARIEENRGFYLSRLKSNVNPLRIGSHLFHRGRAIDLEGKRWTEVAPRLVRGVLDAKVELTFKRRVCAGHRSSDTFRCRRVTV